MSQAEQAGHDTHSHDAHDHGHDAHDHGQGHDAHGHGHDDHGHGHDAHGHGHDDHGHHAPPAPRYLVAPPARVEDISVRSWVAYGIFLLFVVLIAAAMLTGFGR